MKVAVCVDQSKPSKGAVEKAVEFAELSGASLVLLHSVQRSVKGSSGEYVQESEDEAIEKGLRLLEEYEEYARERAEGELELSTEVLTEDQDVNAIVEYIQSNGVQHAFMGHRNLSNRQEQLFGSFAKEMINETTVPVTVVTRNAQ